MNTENYKKLTEQPDFERGHEILEQEVSPSAQNQYLTQYTGIVHEMRKRDQHAQEEAALKIRAIQGDISLTQQQLEQIKSVRYKISQM